MLCSVLDLAGSICPLPGAAMDVSDYAEEAVADEEEDKGGDICEEDVSTAEAIGASADLAGSICHLPGAAMDVSDYAEEAAAVADEEKEDKEAGICEEDMSTAEAIGASADLAGTICPLPGAAMDVSDYGEEAAEVADEEKDKEDVTTAEAIGASADLAGTICPLPGAAMDVSDYGEEAAEVADEEEDKGADICEEEVSTGEATGASLPAAEGKDGSNVAGGVKRVSAYLRFSNQNREQVKSKIVATGGKPTAAALGKALGELWHSLTDAEKEVFKRPASSGEGEQEDQGEAAPGNAVCQVVGAQPSDSGAEKGDAPAPASDAEEAPGRVDDKEVALPAEKEPAAFPLTKVKRIIKLDPDIRVVSSGGVSAIAKATELFVEALASSTFSVVVGSKRRSIRAEDVCSAVRRDPRFRDCIGTSLQCMEDADINGSDEEATEGPRHGQAGKHRTGVAATKNKRVKKALPPPPGSRSIADCFKRLKN